MVWGSYHYELVNIPLPKYLHVPSCNQPSHGMRDYTDFGLSCSLLDYLDEIFEPYSISVYVFAFCRHDNIPVFFPESIIVIAYFDSYRSSREAPYSLLGRLVGRIQRNNSCAQISIPLELVLQPVECVKGKFRGIAFCKRMPVHENDRVCFRVIPA